MKPPNTASSDVSRFEFDSQARSYDRRTQFGDAAARTIAGAAASLARSELALVGPLVIVEVGAGTGEIGAWLAREGQYTGFDAAREMLQAFEARLGASGPVEATLHVCDANTRWPIEDASANLVFFSRVLHLLEQTHVESELRRIHAASGMVVLAGRARRDPDSVGSQLRRLMLTALEDRGYSPRRGERRSAHFFEELYARGAVRLPSREVATIAVVRTARERLDAWKHKGGLGGLDLHADERERVLAEVERWASETWPNLDEPETSYEVYCLEGVRLA